MPLVLGAMLAVSLIAHQGEAGSLHSGVRGIVTVSGCPGPERPGQRCAKRFEGARIRVVRATGGHAVRTFRSHAKGRFRVSLSPGRYRLEPLSSGIARAPTIVVTVRKQRFRYVHIDYDNGLR